MIGCESRPPYSVNGLSDAAPRFAEDGLPGVEELGGIPALCVGPKGNEEASSIWPGGDGCSGPDRPFRIHYDPMLVNSPLPYPVMTIPEHEFTDAHHEELDEWLLRRRTGITDIVELEGFLTAIVIGPNTLSPMLWLPKVWGGKVPRFRDLEEMNRFVALLMGYYNDLVIWFETEPERFQPTFYERKLEGKKILIVDEWCVGFLKGMRLDSAAWKPLKKDRPELLKPLELFGSRAGWKEIDATGDPAQMHKRWSPKITPAVREIHQYWLAVREAKYRAESGERVH
jgi:uncharacterized protein